MGLQPTNPPTLGYNNEFNMQKPCSELTDLFTAEQCSLHGCCFYPLFNMNICMDCDFCLILPSNSKSECKQYGCCYDMNSRNCNDCANIRSTIHLNILPTAPMKSPTILPTLLPTQSPQILYISPTDISTFEVNNDPRYNYIWNDDYIEIYNNDNVWNTLSGIQTGINNIKYHGPFSHHQSNEYNSEIQRQFISSNIDLSCIASFYLIWSCDIESYGKSKDSIDISISSKYDYIYKKYIAIDELIYQNNNRDLKYLYHDIIYAKKPFGCYETHPLWIDKSPSIEFNLFKNIPTIIKFKTLISNNNEYVSFTNFNIKCNKILLTLQ